jgi:hypothetical protein
MQIRAWRTQGLCSLPALIRKVTIMNLLSYYRDIPFLFCVCFATVRLATSCLRNCLFELSEDLSRVVLPLQACGSIALVQFLESIKSLLKLERKQNSCRVTRRSEELRFVVLTSNKCPQIIPCDLSSVINGKINLCYNFVS